MTAQASRYSDWVAPSEDGRCVIWPDGPALIAQTLENHRRLLSANSVSIQNVPLSELRQLQRAWIGHTDPARPLVASGHQTELYHAGVWVKDVLSNALARRLDAEAYHLAIDTDAPKHLHLRWPGTSHPITDDRALATAQWSALVGGPTPGHVAALQEAVSAAETHWPFRPLAGSFLDSMKALSLESTDVAAVTTNAIHQLDWSLGLRHHALVTSPIWHSPPYLAYVYHILARAGDFAHCYNQALAEYRKETGLRSGTRPWPDLRATPASVEACFWEDALSAGVRQRAMVHRGADRFILRAGGDELPLDPAAAGLDAAGELLAFLRRNNLRLSPRALTLTAFFRLLLVDQFVHGIGGGRYDQVTDRVIDRFFDIEPPSFCVTTATLYFPAAVGQRRVNLRPVIQEGRRLRHGLLSQEKMRMVRQIEAAPRKSPQRQKLFFDMHAKLSAALRDGPFQQWRQRLGEAETLAAEQKPLFDRELFYAIQPLDRLEMLMVQYESGLGAS